MKLKIDNSIKETILYLIVGGLSFAIDIGMFHLLSTYIFNSTSEIQVFVSSLLARILSGIFNFFALNYIVFNNHEEVNKKALKYFILWCINYGLNSGLTYIFKFLPMSLTFIKTCVNIFLGIVNYLINLFWIFIKKIIINKKEIEDGNN